MRSAGGSGTRFEVCKKRKKEKKKKNRPMKDLTVNEDAMELESSMGLTL